MITPDPGLALLVPFLEPHLDVCVVESIEDAVGAIREADVALLDSALASPTGFPLAQVLRAWAPTCTLVGLADTCRTRQISTTAIDHVLTKPLCVDHLIRRLAASVVAHGRVAPPIPHAYVSRVVEEVLQGGVATAQVPALASKIGVSRAYLSALFRRDLGCSLKRFLLRARIAVAMQWLVRTDDKLDVIARAVGFADGPHLSRVFYRLAGRWPGQYRRSVTGLGEGLLPGTVQRREWWGLPTRAEPRHPGSGRTR